MKKTFIQIIIILLAFFTTINLILIVLNFSDIAFQLLSNTPTIIRNLFNSVVITYFGFSGIIAIVSILYSLIRIIKNKFKIGVFYYYCLVVNMFYAPIWADAIFAR